VKIDASRTIEALRTLRGGIRQAAQLALRDVMKVAVDEAKATTLWNDQRPLTRGTITKSEGILQGTVSAGGAAHFLEWGTRPHRIEARNGQALRFMVNGQVIYRRSVNHPGTAPRPFLRHARDRAAMAATYAAEIYVSYAIEHAA
jgi:hypothetical protein